MSGTLIPPNEYVAISGVIVGTITNQNFLLFLHHDRQRGMRSIFRY